MTTTNDLAFLVLRVIVGLIMAAHGAQKLFGWFGGGGFKNTSASFEKQGFKPVWLWMGLACLGEFGGGLSLAAGLLTPFGAAGIFGAMLMAIFKTNWKNGFFISKGGYEYNILILVVSVFFGLGGPGAYSLDTVLGIDLHIVRLFVGLAVAAAVVVGAGILTSKPASKPASKPTEPAPKAKKK
jgi:putative oxidoreductase